MTDSDEVKLLPCEPVLKLEWRDGAPGNPWDKEWFIAMTTYGDRVVLRALPEEYTYDFKTADDTYIMRDKVAKWMQFPDSEFIAPAATRPPVVTDEVVERVAKIIDPIWMDPPEGPHVLENYPGHADYYRERARERARAAIAAMPAVVSGGQI